MVCLPPGSVLVSGNPEGKKVGSGPSVLLVEAQVEDVALGEGLLDVPELVLDLCVVKDRFDDDVRVRCPVAVPFLRARTSHPSGWRRSLLHRSPRLRRGSAGSRQLPCHWS